MCLLRQFLACLLLVSGCSRFACADDVRFDLVGPKIEITVTRGARTLPIAEVPTLLPGDLLQVKANLPSTQLNHLLVIVAFLRGTTNEPPDDWFTEIDTWKPDAQRPTRITVPSGAQRAIIFVAPETGGDFDTLRSVVKRNPGLFLRASESLFKASLEEQRIERYLTGMQSVADQNDKVVAARSAKLASALVLKPNVDCFKQPVEDQVDCLTKATSPLLLDSGAAQTISSALSTGASSDFINEASQNDGGAYSAYVGTLVDLVHLIGLMHTAQYRYIPALTLPDGSTLNTRLNAPPSFENPKSVIVIALPPIRMSRAPDLRLDDEKRAFCLRDRALVLPLRGSTILYSTAFAHDLFLDFGEGLQHFIVPLTSDVLAGGLTFAGPVPVFPGQATGHAAQIRATLRGTWGFDTFLGPTLTFQQVEGSGWKLVGADDLVAGHKAQLQLQGNGTACLAGISLSRPATPPETVAFTSSTDGTPIALMLPLDGNEPGTYMLHVLQHGSAPVTLPLRVYKDGDAHITKALISPDRKTVTLIGTGAKSVQQVRVGTAVFVANDQTSATDDAEFRLLGSAPPNAADQAVIHTNDGRTMQIALSTEDASVVLHLLSLKATAETAAGELPVELRTDGAIPLHSMVHFLIATEGKFILSDHLEIEVAGEAKAAQLMFGQNDDGLVLEDAHTAVGTLDVDKAFGASAFGTLRLRVVHANGEKGPWITLGVLVRRPHISAIHCAAESCTVHGRELFLVREFSTTEDFSEPVNVPATIIDGEFSFPPKSHRMHAIYLRLRDDSNSVAVVPITTRK